IFSPAAVRPALRLHGGATSSKPLSTRVIADSKKSQLVAGGNPLGSIDFGLLACFAGWYLGNYYYTLNNKLALNAAGGSKGFPLTIGFLQMLIGSLYALFLWVAPDARALPTTTSSDILKILPVAACAAGTPAPLHPLHPLRDSPHH
ncbi:MAG: hypothetical protein SGPRY_011457, partial [Prymnesium sp.]